ncbi:hypothetical protein X797_008333 [Metarhizium robertsii]|uniref:Uncharacterized protein n=1 Tax=Metarhizium robertsii TaxID=568076 RepID=A0A014P772_9HYPO|nr:hypothetical protein X797_008333 [Metarhizium robertsii]
MTPPCHSFPASELPARIQLDVHGRRRKPAPGANSKIDLSACELLQMLQYKCEVQRPLSRESAVQCFPVDRLFRRYVCTCVCCVLLVSLGLRSSLCRLVGADKAARCADRKGSFMVETTAWEGRNAQLEQKDGDGEGKKRPFQWSGSWHDDVAR